MEWDWQFFTANLHDAKQHTKEMVSALPCAVCNCASTFKNKKARGLAAQPNTRINHKTGTRHTCPTVRAGVHSKSWTNSLWIPRARLRQRYLWKGPTELPGQRSQLLQLQHNRSNCPGPCPGSSTYPLPRRGSITPLAPTTIWLQHQPHAQLQPVHCHSARDLQHARPCARIQHASAFNWDTTTTLLTSHGSLNPVGKTGVSSMPPPLHNDQLLFTKPPTENDSASQDEASVVIKENRVDHISNKPCSNSHNSKLKCSWKLGTL